MSKVVPLVDLQTLARMKNPTDTILKIQPLETNYLIENNIFLNYLRKNYLIKKCMRENIVEVSRFYKPSSNPLEFHLSLQGATESCYLKLCDDDIKIIKEWSKS